MDNSRRNCLCGLGGLAVGGAVAALVGTGGSIARAAAPAKRFEQVNGEFGWKPHKLDPKECAKVAYEGYWYKGYACGYGAFYSIIGVLGEKIRRPVQPVPLQHAGSQQGRHLRLGHHLRRPCTALPRPLPCLGAPGTAPHFQ